MTRTTNYTDDVTYLRGFLGNNFVNWVLNNPGQTLTSAQAEVSHELAKILRQGISERPDLSISFIVKQLASHHEELGTTFINYCHTHTGGRTNVTIESSDDALLLASLAFAAECYGELLLPADGPMASRPDFYHYHKTKVGRDVVRAIRDEGIFPLGEGFHEDSDESALSYIHDSRPGRFATELILCAWSLAKLEFGIPSVDQLASKVVIALEQLRSLFSGHLTAITTVTSLTGVRLPEGMEVSGTWGKIRAARASDHPTSLLHLTDRRTIGSDETGETVEITDAGDVIFETSVRVKLTVNKDGSGWSSTGIDDFEDLVDRVRLSLALAITRLGKPVVYSIWSVAFLPTGHIEPFHPLNEPRFMAPRSPTILTEDEIMSLKNWIGILMGADTSRLKVAMTRTLRALAERRDPADRLIDAVIARESLFGATNESTMRVSASLARLLHAAGADREAARKRYGKIYQARSDIVHANKTKTTAAQLDEYSRSAIEASLQVMALLLTTHSGLLDMDSPARSEQVILGADALPTLDSVSVQGEQNHLLRAPSASDF